MGKLVFVWDNFGPLHSDRCNAVAKKFEGREQVIGLDLPGRARCMTGYPRMEPTSGRLRWSLAVHWRRSHSQNDSGNSCGLFVGGAWRQVFHVPHDQDPAIFAVALTLRLLGKKIFTMGCSKFDDYQRRLGREVVKTILYLPYNGAIASGVRSRDYMRFMGLRANRIKTPYNPVSLERIRSLSGSPPAPDGVLSETDISRLSPAWW